MSLREKSRKSVRNAHSPNRFKYFAAVAEKIIALPQNQFK